MSHVLTSSLIAVATLAGFAGLAQARGIPSVMTSSSRVLEGYIERMSETNPFAYGPITTPEPIWPMVSQFGTLPEIGGNDAERTGSIISFVGNSQWRHQGQSYVGLRDASSGGEPNGYGISKTHAMFTTTATLTFEAVIQATHPQTFSALLANTENPGSPIFNVVTVADNLELSNTLEPGSYSLTLQANADLFVPYSNGTAYNEIVAYTHADAVLFDALAITAGFTLDNMGDLDALAYIGSARPDPAGQNIAELTRINGYGESGSVWYKAGRLELASGFETTFAFSISPDPAFNGDGFALVLHNDRIAKIRDSGSYLGYTGWSKGLAIEIDTFGFDDEFPTPHLSVQAGLDGPLDYIDSTSLGYALLDNSILDGLVHLCRVVYTAGATAEVDGQLAIYIDGATAPVLTTIIPASAFATSDAFGPNGLSWAGFTGATGAATATHAIHSWSFSTGPQGPLSCGLADVASDSLDTARTPNNSIGPEDLDAFIAGFIAENTAIADVASDSLDTTYSPNGFVGPEDLDAFIGSFVAGC